MKINNINSVFELILTSYTAGVTTTSTARLVKHTTSQWPNIQKDCEVLSEVYDIAIQARAGLNEEVYKFVKRVLASLENLYQNQ